MRVFPSSTTSFLREVHIQRPLRDRYQLDSALFSYRGGRVEMDLSTARRLAQTINNERSTAAPEDQPIRASDLVAYGLIEEIYHHIVDLYREQVGAELFQETLSAAEKRLASSARANAGSARETLAAFVERFPATEVYTGSIDPSEYLSAKRNGEEGIEVALEETLMVWLANENRATRPFAELFDDEELERQTAYAELIEAARTHLDRQPPFERTGESLIDTLLAPIRAHPDSLTDQLDFIRQKWGSFLGTYLMQMLRTLDFLREEHRPGFGGRGPSQVYDYTGIDEDSERFSPDREWMPRVILLAKSTFVWLDQLSKRYGREISTLDQIPDKELDEIAARGFTGLWLIGLWERSTASRRIKHLTGNPDATASAYSLMNYEIAGELGGWDALANLRGRLWHRGVRIASDMVPNHTGIDSDWMERHPDWFVQLDHPPFPSYTFGGENLSSRPGVEIYLEDHYYDRSDAAVVFKRRDSNSGEERYIYHGNDGTGLPWSDTAQLDFLKKEVREATVQTILHVARNFPIIRFDAAMVLAKKHFHRLWYPEPGSGGDIASRAEHGMTREQFDVLFPTEFWREVVDRVSSEVPDTLLLAEAFWMMEGYFVRTLGMHRVYNSAFMNMLKDEENAKYRQTIKNTLTFDKQILKRFVNFMNNPDEETAVAQFGDDDKYFGVCTVMITMPGLPMFGHGQVEGFTEKYGMEYRRAMQEEQPNRGLIERHEREIFPLAKRRYLFAEVENFLLFDFTADHGGINENVFAYSNRAGQATALVLYNNRYEQAHGTIKDSVEFVDKVDGEKVTLRSTLADALSLSNETDAYCMLYEERSGLWYMRRSSDIWNHGLHAVLNGYQTQVFTQIQEIIDDDQHNYARLHDYLEGAGTTSIELAFQEMRLKPVYDALRGVIASEAAGRLAHSLYLAGRPAAAEAQSSATRAEDRRPADSPIDEQVRQWYGEAIQDLVDAIEADGEYSIDRAQTIARSDSYLRAAAEAIASIGDEKQVLELAGDQQLPEIVILALILVPAIALRDEGVESVDLVRNWLLYRVFEEQMTPEIRGRLDAGEWRTLVEVVLAESAAPLESILGSTSDPAATRERGYAHVHEHQDTTWFDRDRFRTLLFWRWVAAAISALAGEAESTRTLKQLAAKVRRIIKAEKACGYDYERFLKELQKPRDGAKKTTGRR